VCQKKPHGWRLASGFSAHRPVYAVLLLRALTDETV